MEIADPAGIAAIANPEAGKAEAREKAQQGTQRTKTHTPESVAE
jgi:hypothetical protein